MSGVQGLYFATTVGFALALWPPLSVAALGIKRAIWGDL
jgi:hypothetical protein